MKRLITGLILLAASPAWADTTLSIELAGVSSNEGQLVISVYDSEKSWLKTPSHQDVINAAGVTDGRIMMEMELPPGDYAVYVYHDLDSNGRMKASFIGVPKEPTGVSRDAKGKLGPPKFKDAMITVGDDPVSLTINIVSI